MIPIDIISFKKYLYCPSLLFNTYVRTPIYACFITSSLIVYYTSMLYKLETIDSLLFCIG